MKKLDIFIGERVSDTPLELTPRLASEHGQVLSRRLRIRTSSTVNNVPRAWAGAGGEKHGGDRETFRENLH
jgi:hypothetical protein